MIDYKVLNKNSIHISFDKTGAESLILILENLLKLSSISIHFDTPTEYKGKGLNEFKFSVVDEGEFVFFKEGVLNFEIEGEMVEEFILFIENAIKNEGFKTPEIISFSPKSKKDVEVTIYGFLDMNGS